MADITYVPTWAYLAVVVDAFSRRVVGWSMAGHLRTKLVVEALDMALGQRRPEGVVHHSDRGCQYTSLAFATLECEFIERTSFRTHADARGPIFEFIEGWYNPHRRHSSLGYLSPSAFEQAAIEPERLDWGVPNVRVSPMRRACAIL